MTFDQTILTLLASVGGAVFVTHGVVRLRNAKSSGVFVTAGAITSINGLNALPSLFRSEPQHLGKGIVELRPSWITRLLVPLVVFMALALTDLTPLWRTVGIHSSHVHSVLFAILGMGLGYVWFILLFVQRLVYDDQHLMLQGFGWHNQTRDLSELTEIQMQDHLSGLTLEFEKQETLNVPWTVSHRAAFVETMEKIVKSNINNGAVLPLPAWQERLSA